MRVSPSIVQRPLFARWTDAWSRLNRRHALGLALAILLMTAIDLSTLADKLDRPGVVSVIVFDLFVAVALFSITLLAWSAAVAGRPPSGAERMRAVVIAIVASGVLSAAVVVPIMNAAGIPEIWHELMGKKRPAPPLWLGILGNTVHLALFAALFVLVAEVLQRRSATNAAVLAARREQAAVAHEVLESRLAAMQAQVEPQFLFNSLVGIEALYRKDADAAAENLDRLIQYLRVALPRLREPGSTIAGEIDLVRAYLAVVTSLHGGRPALDRHGRRRLRGRALLPDAAAAADPAGRAGAGRPPAGVDPHRRAEAPGRCRHRDAHRVQRRVRGGLRAGAGARAARAASTAIARRSPAPSSRGTRRSSPCGCRAAAG